jgi:hypothetical protein
LQRRQHAQHVVVFYLVVAQFFEEEDNACLAHRHYLFNYNTALQIGGGGFFCFTIKQLC